VGLGCVFVCRCVCECVMCVFQKVFVESDAGGGVGEGVYSFVCVSMSVLCVCIKGVFRVG